MLRCAEMIRWLAVSLFVVCLALFGWVQYLRVDSVSLRADIASLSAENQRLDRNSQILQRQIYAAARAQAVYAQFRSDQAARDAKLRSDSKTIEGIPDAPLHPDLADLVNGL